MREHRRRLGLAVVAGVFGLFAGCGSSPAPGLVAGCGSSPAPVGPSTSSSASTQAAAAPDTGALKVFAAASLTQSFTAAKTTMTASNPRLSLTFNFAGSNALVTQIIQGAPADVVATADQANMTKLEAANLVESPVVFARNKLEIAVAAGNPKKINGLADLAKPGVSVVLEAAGVPAGDYTCQAEARLGISIAPKSLEPDVKAALTKVTTGEADATVVYVSDVRGAGSRVTGIQIPDEQNVIATYPIAVVKATNNPAGASAFVRSAVAGEVQRALESDGFLALGP